MYSIRVPPDHLREAALVLASQKEAVRFIGEELQQAVGRLDTWAWDGHSRARVEPLLSRAGPESHHLAKRLEDLSRKLESAAEEFERVDSLVADPLTSVFEQISAGAEWVENLLNPVSTIQTAFAAGIIAALIQQGTTYAGQVKVYGPRQLKDWAGLSTHLTHIKAANLPLHMAKQALKVSVIDVLFEGGSELDENWKEYKGNLIKMGAGVAVDTAIGVGVTVAAGAAGAYIGAMIGTLILPGPGTVIGGTVGKIAAQWVVKHSQIDEKIENIRIGGKELDQLVVDEVEASLEPFISAVASGFRK